MKTTKVNVHNKLTKQKFPTGLKLLIRRCCIAVLEEEGIKDVFEIDVTFVDASEIKLLNSQFRGKDQITDVLSFPLGEEGQYDTNPDTGMQMLGDIVICMETACTQAENYGHSLQREVGFLTVHSMLHLLGYDHEQDARSAARMREKEELVMEALDLKRNTGYRGF